MFERQAELILQFACVDFINAVKELGLSSDRIPRLVDLTSRLQALTGWSVTAVDALISFEKFFTLLSKRVFPIATFIRRREDLDYLKEPDVFHEVYGHCSWLADPNFAEFNYRIGKLGVTLSQQQRVYLARLYWFTVEFGVLQTADGVKALGAGIVSSFEELRYSVESVVPRRLNFDLVEIMRTPYRYDELQRSYFMLPSIDFLLSLSERDIVAAIDEAIRLGLYPSQHDIVLDDNDTRSC